MKRDLRFVLTSLLFVALLAIFSFGQETTGSIEITIKDKNGDAVPNVAVTITGTSGGFKRNATTDDSGFYKFIQVPPGNYTVEVAATSGFGAAKKENVTVGLGRVASVPIEMVPVGSVNTVVVEADTVGINISDTSGGTGFTSEAAELLPKGTNFASILKFAPAARPESRSGQFQIDGASASENVFIIDGQEVSDVLTGALDRNSNLPFSLVQETQIKTSGFEAEYGGATGGVINVVTKSGGNDLHGEFGINLRTSRLEPIGGPILRFPDPVPPQRYASRRDQFNETNPTAALLGPIWKDKVWFAVGYAPQIFTRSRELNYKSRTTLEPYGFSQTFYAKQRNDKVFGRVDAQPFSKLHLNANYQWNPETQTGAIPGFTSELLSDPTIFTTAAYSNQTGGRLNSLNFIAGGSYIVTNDLVATARIGHYFLNNKLGTYGVGGSLTPRVFCDARVPLPSQPLWPLPNAPNYFGCVGGGGNNQPASGIDNFDYNIRDQIDVDATYSFSIGGRHELKGGYQTNETKNNVASDSNDVINIKWGVWSTQTPANTVSWLTQQSGITLAPAAGAIGFGKLTYYSVRSNSIGTNKAFYVQDQWKPLKGLTLNLGLRAEREEVPGFYPGAPGIDFSWGSKFTPRIGAAYDLTGDGKTKITGFYGLFYDRFKLTMSRRTFGGEVYHFLYFDILPGDSLSTFNNRDAVMGAGGPANLIPGGSCTPNSTAPIFGRVRCDQDTSAASFVGTPIDPDLKPFQQREITFGVQRELSKNYIFAARYTRKQVLHAVEDVAFPTTAASCCNNYITGNPGEGLAKELADEFGFVSPKAQRQYDALELRIDRRFANNYYFSANYTYSRLYGNYGGTASSDEEGRLEPNIERYFDSPGAGFTAQGGPDNGRLPTDRPHVLKAFGAYSLPWDKFGLWKNNSTDLQLFFTAQSGTVLTSFVQIDGVEQVVLYKRGDLGRTPLYTQTDLAVRHTIEFGSENRFKLKLEADVINLFNEYVVQSTGRSNLAPLYQGGNMISPTNFSPVSNPSQANSLGLISQAQYNACSSSGNYGPCWGAAYKALQTGGSQNLLTLVGPGGSATRNPFYNVPTSYQTKRTVRYGVRLLF